MSSEDEYLCTQRLVRFLQLVGADSAKFFLDVSQSAVTCFNICIWARLQTPASDGEFRSHDDREGA